MRDPIILLTETAANVIALEAPASADGSETGGILLGHDAGGTIRVTVAGGPGPGAERRPDGFLRDLEHARRLGDDAYDRDGSVWIGEWHTHPKGPDAPSATDQKTYRRLLADTDLCFSRFVCLIVISCPLHGWAEPLIRPWIVDGDGARRITLEVNASPFFEVDR